MMERTIKKEEAALLSCLLQKANKKFTDVDKLKVIPLADGKMGSLYIVSTKKQRNDRKLGAVLSEKQFFDSDDIPILVSLNIDKDGDLYELDIWKADFSPVKSYPTCKQ